MPEKKSDLKKMLASAHRPRRVVSICMRGDLTARAQEIEDQLQALDERPVSDDDMRLAGNAKRPSLAQELEDLRAEMRDSAVQLTLEAVPAASWRQLKAEHPVSSEPSPTDSVIGADATGFFNAAVRQAIVEPEVDDEDWEKLTEVLSEGEWSKLVEAVYVLNEEPVSIPFSSRAYGILRTLSDDSGSPEA